MTPTVGRTDERRGRADRRSDLDVGGRTGTGTRITTTEGGPRYQSRRPTQNMNRTVGNSFLQPACPTWVSTGLYCETSRDDWVHYVSGGRETV